MTPRIRDTFRRTPETFDVAQAINIEASEIESLLEGRTDISLQIRQKVRDVLMLSRNLKSDTDPDIPIILRAIYQLRGVFNLAHNVTIGNTGWLDAAQRNAEHARLLRRLDQGGLTEEDIASILRRADELNAMK